MLPLKRSTTHTGVAGSSGSGGPKVAPLIVPAPVAPRPVHEESAPPQSLRQKSRIALPTMGKLWEPPFQPLSRSPPTPPATTVRVSSLGPPAGFTGQDATGNVVVVTVV